MPRGLDVRGFYVTIAAAREQSAAMNTYINYSFWALTFLMATGIALATLIW
ncbi:MAG: hypothetical protein ACM3TN_06800 [Alphaproteobacteria bacterium]